MIYYSHKKQTGVVLVISLIMLLLLTIIGITSMQVTGLEEKMAGNYRDHNIAFQAAETALRAGEANIFNIVALGAFDGTNGLLGDTDDLHDYSAATTWSSNANSIEYIPNISGMTTKPRYYIKFLSTGVDSSAASINISSYGNSNAGGALSYFLVTARGTGGRDSTPVILRSHYAKRF